MSAITTSTAAECKDIWEICVCVQERIFFGGGGFFLLHILLEICVTNLQSIPPPPPPPPPPSLLPGHKILITCKVPHPFFHLPPFIPHAEFNAPKSWGERREQQLFRGGGGRGEREGNKILSLSFPLAPLSQRGVAISHRVAKRHIL